jgi:mannose-6-phosphate isomerase-like protein (cupin superfamily)
MAGCGLMNIDKESFEVGPGCAVYIPPRATQYIKNTSDSDLIFLCIVDPAWRKEDEEILDGISLDVG